MPTALLERRPDIRDAEQNLIAANAQIGVAKAPYFPQLSLSGLLGWAEHAIIEPVQRSTQRVELCAAAHAAHIHGWRLRSNVRLAEAQRDSVLVQCLDCSTKGERESRVQQQALVAALEDPKRLARYTGGVDTQLNSLHADRDLLQAELDFRQIRLNELLSVVQLYKAHGDGWQ